MHLITPLTGSGIVLRACVARFQTRGTSCKLPLPITHCKRLASVGDVTVIVADLVIDFVVAHLW